MDNEKQKRIAIGILAFVGWHQIPKPLRDDIWSGVFGGIAGALSGAGQGAIRSAAPVVEGYKILPEVGDKDVSLAGWMFLIGLCFLFYKIVAPMASGNRPRPSPGVPGGMRRSMDDDDDTPMPMPPRSPSRPGPGVPSSIRGPQKKGGGIPYLPVAVGIAGVVLLVTTPQGKMILDQLPLDQITNLRSMLPF